MWDGTSWLRDLLARRIPGGAGPLELGGYVVLAAWAVLEARRAGLDARALGLGWDRLGRRLLGGLVLGGLLALPAFALGVATPLLPLVAATMPRALGVATVEELLFRGILLEPAVRAAGPTGGALADGVAFGLAHAAVYPAPTLLVASLAGSLLAAWRLSRDDLLAPIVGHAIADALLAAMPAG